MSGIVGSKLNIRGSGRIAKLGTDGQVLTSSGAGEPANYEDVAGGGLDWQAIETGSTMTAVAGEGYWIDTTSNACTITLPSSASNGDEIMFADYARTWGTYGIILDSNGLNYQGQGDTYDVEYGTDGTALHIVYSGATNGWIPTLDKTVEDVPSTGNDNGIMAYGYIVSGAASMSNLISNVGVVATDVSGVGTTRYYARGVEYGGDKAIVGYGTGSTTATNLISNAGVVATDVTAVGTARGSYGACEYGNDKGIFAFGTALVEPTGMTNVSNLISNVGVIATDVTGVGTARRTSACEYGGDKGICAYGMIADSTEVSLSNLISNAGVVATDVTGVGTARQYLSACSYGGDKGIFAYGTVAACCYQNISNLVSSVGVVSTDVTGVGTIRPAPGGCEYGQDKGIFVYGGASSNVSNLVSNTGVVASDVTGVGSARNGPAGCSYN